jgi:hypothetical protein
MKTAICLLILSYSASLMAKTGAFVENEKHQGKTWQRVRVIGKDANKICKAMGLDLSSAKKGALFNNESMTCFVSDSGPGFGFLVGPSGEISHLEQFGYK